MYQNFKQINAKQLLFWTVSVLVITCTGVIFLFLLAFGYLGQAHLGKMV